MKKLGFTFIEIMVAILVFAIGVLAVLSLLTTNLRGMDNTDLRLQGTLFAKEGLELVYNLRDSNRERELPWNCILSKNVYGKDSNGLIRYLEDDYPMRRQPQQVSVETDIDAEFFSKICDSYFGEQNPIQISYSDRGYILSSGVNLIDDFDMLFENNLIYSYESGDVVWFSHENSQGSKETVFARYLTFQPVLESGVVLDTGKILKVQSHVLWRKGGYTGEVVLDSFIGNY